jgi:SpoVK/Ycf46/Vps4 family AAA+-type ATPase
MPTLDQLSKLFKAIARTDSQLALHLASEIATSEEKKGHRTAAQLLRASLVLNGAKSSIPETAPQYLNGSATLLGGALSNKSSSTSMRDVYLRADARKSLEEVAKEFRNDHRLRALRIKRRSKLIFHGPPGCGKTFAAQAIANELGLQLFVVRFDSIIGAYLGQTATHLRQLFQFSESNKCVLLFDEIDALGKRRGSPTDVGELDRIVIALMQELELSAGEGLVIATSNLPGSLDPALWRRFDLAIHFPAPRRDEMSRFASTKAKSFGLRISRPLRRKISSLRNYAEVEKAIEAEARRIALKNL